MSEQRTVICEVRGKRVIIPDVTKIILALKKEGNRHQASININIKNISIIRRRIR